MTYWMVKTVEYIAVEDVLNAASEEGFEYIDSLSLPTEQIMLLFKKKVNL